MPQKTYTLGVIGCGKIWEIGHLPALKELAQQIRVKYVHDTAPALAAKAAADAGARAVDSDEPIFADKEVDLVCVATPPIPRAGYVRKACAAGKHMMIEKPMARTLADALDIVSSVRGAGVKCFVPFVRGVSALYRTVAQAARAGRWGQPLAFYHNALGTPYPWIPLDHWMHDQALGGGPIFDFSIHFMEVARACLGEAAEVTYFGGNLAGRLASDDHATLLARYASGALGEFTKSWAFPPGAEGTPIVSTLICHDAVIHFGEKPQVRTAAGTEEYQVPPGTPNGRAGAYRNLLAAIEGGEALYADEICGLRMMELLDAMERSRASGRSEPVTIHTM